MKFRPPLAATRRFAGVTLAAACLPILSQGGLEPQGAEFALTSRLPGDQVQPSIALGADGGLVVWQDPGVDGEGLGIAALRLNGTLSPVAGGPFRVNEAVAGDQENAQAIVLADGSALVVWQSGPIGFQRIRGRLLGAGGTFLTGDLTLSEGTGEHQIEPAIARLAGGDVVVVWSSYRQDGPNYDVFLRRFGPDGQARGPEQRVNEQLGLGRRSPAVAAIEDGGFVVAWVGERVVGERDNRDRTGRRVPGTGAPVFEVALYARAFDAAGVPTTSDQRVAGTDAVAAHPALARLPDGRLLLSWSRRHPSSRDASLDVAAKVLNADGSSASAEVLLNAHTYGDQYRPRLTSGAGGVLAVWSSMGEDGSWEGVYGRWIGSDGAPSGDGIRINTTVGGGQILPAVASAAGGGFLVAWSSNLPQSGFDLFAQRLAGGRGMAPLPAPHVAALSSSSVMVSWAPVVGLEVSGYRVYGGNGSLIAETKDAYWSVENLPPSSSFAAQVAYVLGSGELSPRSPLGTGKTWGADRNFDGLPDDWQAQWWPGGPPYPAGSADADGDGATNLEEWLAGTDPTNGQSCLKVQGQTTALGLRLQWSTQPGLIYQLQSSTDGRSWVGLGAPRFAADTSDSVTLGASGQVAFYRVLRVR